jgi:hypothetical protein
MTENQGPDAAHLGLDRISDLEEGLLNPAEEQAAREHLAGCAQCQDDLAALTAVREALLADAEIAMPDDVADRLYAALAELPPYEAPTIGAVTTLPAPRTPSRWDTRRKPTLIALSAAAVIALFAVGVTQIHGSSNSGKESAAAAATTAPAVPILHTGRNYTASELAAGGVQLLALANVGGPVPAAAGVSAAAATTAAAATSAAAPAATSAAAAAASAAPAASVAAATSAAAAASSAASAAGTTAAAAATTTGHVVTDNGAGGSTGAGASAPDVLAQLRAPGAAQNCVTELLPSAGTPLVIDFATFAGKPAVIGVFNDPDDPTKLDVIAVGPPSCSLYSLSRTNKP